MAGSVRGRARQRSHRGQQEPSGPEGGATRRLTRPEPGDRRAGARSATTRNAGTRNAGTRSAAPRRVMTRSAAGRLPGWHLIGIAAAVGTAVVLMVYALTGRVSQGEGPGSGAARDPGGQEVPTATAPAATGPAPGSGQVAPAGLQLPARVPTVGWGELRVVEGPVTVRREPVPTSPVHLDPGPRWAETVAASPAAPQMAAAAQSTSPPRRPGLEIAGPAQVRAGERATYWVQRAGGGRIGQVPIWVVARGGELAWVDIGGELHTRAPGTVLLRAVVGDQWLDKTVEVVAAGS